MKSPDESVSDSDKIKFQALYEQMKNHPGFAELLGSSAKTEPTLVTTRQRDSDLKATRFNEDEELEIKNNFIIEERCRALASQSKFYEAISVLDDLNETNENEFEIKLLMAECYIQLGRETKAEKALKDVKKILMGDTDCNIDDVMALAKDITHDSNNVRALLLFQIVGGMFKASTSLSSDEIVGGIFQCVAKMQKVVEIIIAPTSTPQTKNKDDLNEILQALMGSKGAIGPGQQSDMETVKAAFANQSEKPIEIKERSKIIALDYGISVMEEMLEDLRNIPGTDPGNIALKQAVLANMINHTYSITRQHNKAITLLQTAIAQMEKHFGKNINQHKIYITILVNIGAELHNSERFRETEKIQMKALDEIDHVLDFNSEEERQAETKRIRDVLRITRLHLKLN